MLSGKLINSAYCLYNIWYKNFLYSSIYVFKIIQSTDTIDCMSCRNYCAEKRNNACDWNRNRPGTLWYHCVKMK